MNDSETSLQGGRRELRRPDVYNHRQLWPPLDDPQNPVRLPIGTSLEVYLYTFSSLDLANFEKELADAKRQKAVEELNPVARLEEGWYLTAPWWSMFVPAIAIILYLFQFWVAPLFRIGYFHGKKHANLTAPSALKMDWE